MESCRDKSRLLKLLSRYKESEGWFRTSIESFDVERCTGRLVCEGIFEAKQFNSDRPSCFFTKGFLKGFLTQLYSKEVSVDEVACASKGDEKCVFEVKPEG